ncbi:ornithine racemase Orr [Clostridium swellfunianum]|uniref:ornithine racemase Orr n=1 Tax=Clostridium swellfunianum TaxID=1367462 RepID=UPI002030425F|nr:ornithine racemase Orr [Clostridium swellfunianum]MCM0648779.1 ornithine racemase Orr [Clostridium swellfunianum]
MKKKYPCIEINLNKIIHNTKKIVDICKSKEIHIVGVSKVFGAKKPIVEAMLRGGIEIIGDSRIENLKRIGGLKCRKMLLRIPMESQAVEIIKYCDISLNSEIDTVKKLSDAARRLNKIHHIILMVDLGDLREGILEKDVLQMVTSINRMPNIRLCGIGTNLTCYGGVIPDKDNLGRLMELRKKIEKSYGLRLPIISGGNSSSLYAILNNTIPKGINQLRIGEAIVLGRETAFGNHITGCYRDSFILKGEIIEIKEKPSVPVGTIGIDAFGQIPKFEDKGIIKRAIIALGRQDIVPEGIESVNTSVKVLGASSDHLIVDITNCNINYNIGDVIDFYMDYGCILRVMTSPYVKKYYVELKP